MHKRERVTPFSGFCFTLHSLVINQLVKINCTQPGLGRKIQIHVITRSLVLDGLIQILFTLDCALHRWSDDNRCILRNAETRYGLWTQVRESTALMELGLWEFAHFACKCWDVPIWSLASRTRVIVVLLNVCVEMCNCVSIWSLATVPVWNFALKITSATVTSVAVSTLVLVFLYLQSLHFSLITFRPL